MSKSWQTTAIDELAMLECGAQLVKGLKQGSVLYLTGDLGAGKTTFTRGFLRGLGHIGNVKSPTYTLVEPYEFAHSVVYHFDLYRLQDPEELELLGIRDYFHDKSLVLVEWPSRGEPVLPAPDLTLDISVLGEGRALQFTAFTAKGYDALQQLSS
jgi:tRNA threonylcarbamoyladenosine biosynthesis protein TsaE